MIGEDETRNEVLTAGRITQKIEEKMWEREEAVDT